VGTIDGRVPSGAARAGIDEHDLVAPDAPSETTVQADAAPPPADAGAPPPTPDPDTFAVSPDDLVALGRVASKAKLVRDALQGRDEAIAVAVTDDGIDLAAVAHAVGLTPAEVATIVFVQEANPSPFTRLRRKVRRRQPS
jgi:hypothetical protein